MRKSNSVISAAAAVVSAVVCASGALGQDQVAVVAPAPSITPEAQAHFDHCVKQQSAIRSAGEALKAIKTNGKTEICSARLKLADHDDRMVAFLRECSPELGMSDADAGRKMLEMSVYARGLRDGCTPKAP